MWCWHKWTKWERKNEKWEHREGPELKLLFFNKQLQERHCEKCGYIQREILSSGRESV